MASNKPSRNSYCLIFEKGLPSLSKAKRSLFSIVLPVDFLPLDDSLQVHGSSMLSTDCIENIISPISSGYFSISMRGEILVINGQFQPQVIRSDRI